GSPGAVKSAPNCFSGKIANKFQPPLEAGNALGVVAVDNGFVVPYAKKITAIRNTRDSGSGVDEDYKLFVIDETEGCIAPDSVRGVARSAILFTARGLRACDLFKLAPRPLTRDIYAHPMS